MDYDRLRRELTTLGPERVRKGMIAFEHRAKGSHGSYTVCCFLKHAFDGCDLADSRYYLTHTFFEPHVELAFEERNLHGTSYGPGSREALRQECIAFLAEHGEAPEAAPAPAEVASCPTS